VELSGLYVTLRPEGFVVQPGGSAPRKRSHCTEREVAKVHQPSPTTKNSGNALRHGEKRRHPLGRSMFFFVRPPRRLKRDDGRRRQAIRQPPPVVSRCAWLSRQFRRSCRPPVNYGRGTLGLLARHSWSGVTLDAPKSPGGRAQKLRRSRPPVDRTTDPSVNRVLREGEEKDRGANLLDFGHAAKSAWKALTVNGVSKTTAHRC